MIHIQKLTKRYGDFLALNECSFSVESGEVFGLLGPNGAGKTTLLRLLLGFLRPSDGQAAIQGLDCYRDRVRVHANVSYLPADARLFRTMRGHDVLRFFSEIRSDACLQRALAIAQRLDLDLKRWVVFMSTGMRQKLALSVVLSIASQLLILDEPTENLDPSVRGEVMSIVQEAKADGRTVLFSSHVLSEVEEVCDRVGILRQGRLVHTQEMKQLKRQHRITATLNAPLPTVPEKLQDQLAIVMRTDQQVQIETPGELSVILQWLAQAQLADVMIEPVGLRSVYDQYHQEDSQRR